MTKAQCTVDLSEILVIGREKYSLTNHVALSKGYFDVWLDLGGALCSLMEAIDVLQDQMDWLPNPELEIKGQDLYCVEIPNYFPSPASSWLAGSNHVACMLPGYRTGNWNGPEVPRSWKTVRHGEIIRLALEPFYTANQEYSKAWAEYKAVVNSRAYKKEVLQYKEEMNKAKSSWSDYFEGTLRASESSNGCAPSPGFSCRVGEYFYYTPTENNLMTGKKYRTEEIERVEKKFKTLQLDKPIFSLQRDLTQIAEVNKKLNLIASNLATVADINSVLISLGNIHCADGLAGGFMTRGGGSHNLSNLDDELSALFDAIAKAYGLCITEEEYMWLCGESWANQDIYDYIPSVPFVDGIEFTRDNLIYDFSETPLA